MKQRNNQTTSPIIRLKEKQEQPLLQLHSIFNTIQGEGPFVGHSAVFVRLAGCNLQCPNCDTEYTTPNTGVNEASILESVAKLANPRFTPLVVITGGEPLRQPIGKLCRMLINAGYTVQLETNGTAWQPCVEFNNENLYVVCSPKTPKVHPKIREWVDAWKYVVNSRNVGGLKRKGLPTSSLDLIFEKELAYPNCSNYTIDPASIYVSPEDEQNTVAWKQNVAACILLVNTHGYTLSLQTHKIIGVL